MYARDVHVIIIERLGFLLGVASRDISEQTFILEFPIQLIDCLMNNVTKNNNSENKGQFRRSTSPSA